MNKIYIVLPVLAVLLLPSAAAYEVAEEEVSVPDAGDIVFENYRGPYDVVKTLDEIFGIGTNLGMQEGAERQIDGQFIVIHAVDPETDDGFDADIFIFGPEGYVDHIRNVRRILAGYLEAAYQYGREDALLLAKFITYYNAVHRGDMEFIQSRYKKAVTDNLVAEKIGIPLSYKDWPGKTMMVIPLTRKAEEGGLGSLESDELSDEEVIEDLQEEEDRGVEDRKELVDLKEREIEEEEQDIEEERRRIEEEEAAGPGPETEREQDDMVEDGGEEEPSVEERREELEERERQLEERREDLEEERQEIAEDEQLNIEEEERQGDDDPGTTAAAVREGPGREETAEGTLFLRTTRDGYGTIVKIDFETGNYIIRSPISTVLGREYYPLRDTLLVVFEDDASGSATLGLIDSETLELSVASEEVVYEDTYVLLQGASIYAVVKKNGGWALGRFNGALELEASTDRNIAPYTIFIRVGDYIYAQDDSDTVTSFDRETLR